MSQFKSISNLFIHNVLLQIAPMNMLRHAGRSQVAKPMVGSVAFKMASTKSTKAAEICQAQTPKVRLEHTDHFIDMCHHYLVSKNIAVVHI